MIKITAIDCNGKVKEVSFPGLAEINNPWQDPVLRWDDSRLADRLGEVFDAGTRLQPPVTITITTEAAP